jgi:hypothetical protein
MPAVFTHGKSNRLFLNQYHISDYFRGSAITNSREALDSTSYGDDDRAFTPGHDDATWSAEGFFRKSTGESLFNAFKGAMQAAAILTQCPAGTALGAPAAIMQGNITAIDVPTSTTELIGLSVELQASGGARWGVVTHPDQAETAAATPTDVASTIDNAASTATGYTASFHVRSISGAGLTIRLRIMHSADNVTYAMLAQADFTGQGAALVKGAGTVNRYLRDSRQIAAGTLTSVQYLAALARQQ